MAREDEARSDDVAGQPQERLYARARNNHNAREKVEEISLNTDNLP